jgi:flagellar FliJ protein
MKKFQFSLGRMRDYRERLLEEEKGTLQRYKAERNQIEDEIARLEGEFGELSRRMQEKAEKGTTVIELRKLSAQMDNVRMQIRELEKALTKAEQRVEKQMQVVVEANKEVTKLDKLEEKQLEEYRRQVNKAEEDRIDEFVSQALPGAVRLNGVLVS